MAAVDELPFHAENFQHILKIINIRLGPQVSDPLVEKFLARHADRAAAHDVASHLALAQKRLALATTRARAALAAPDQTGVNADELRVHLAQCLARLNKQAEARAVAEPLLAQEAFLPAATPIVVNGMVASGDRAAATALTAEMLRRAPRAEWAWALHLDLLTQSGAYAEAAATLDAAGAAVPLGQASFFAISGVLLGCGRIDDAVALLDRMEAATPGADHALRMRFAAVRLRALVARGELDAGEALLAALQATTAEPLPASLLKILRVAKAAKTPPPTLADRPEIEAARQARDYTQGATSVRQVFAPDSAGPSLGAWLPGLQPGPAKALRTLGARVGVSSRTPGVDLLTFTDVTLCIGPEFYMLELADKSLAQASGGHPGAEQLAALRTSPMLGEVNEMGLVFNHGETNYALWTANWLPQMATLAELLPGCLLGIPRLVRRGFQEATIQIFGLANLPRLELGPGRWKIRKLHLLSAAVQGLAQHAFQCGNTHYAQPLLRRRPAPPAKPGLRLFIDRPPPERRTVLNREPMLALLARHGFQPVDMGSLPNADQAALVGNATHIVGLHGAALANLLHCRPGTRVLEVHSPDHTTLAFACTAYVTGCTYRPIFGTSIIPEGGVAAAAGTGINFNLPLAVLQEGLDWLLSTQGAPED